MRLPGRFAAVPEMFFEVPKMFTGVLEMIVEILDMFVKIPDLFSKFRNCRARGVLELFGNVPENRQRIFLSCIKYG